MNHKVRKMDEKDIPSVMNIIDEAKAYFKENGIPQWQDGYPNADTILDDIRKGYSYVLEENNQIIGIAAIITTADPDYGFIEGKWLNDEPYIVIHRIALKPEKKGKNYASLLLEYAGDLAASRGLQNLRIDTHERNLSMRRFLKKNGFTECGTVYIRGKDPRIAYQKVL